MILDEIVANKQIEVAESKRRTPLAGLEKLAAGQRPPLDFAAALRGNRIRIIAEVKKASPSRGVIRADFDPVQIALTYAANGAAAISVLTDEKYFQGSLSHLLEIGKARADKRVRQVPLLRKDFIFDPYQVYESRACGADAILLIVAILDARLLKDLLNLSRSLGMACLVETHNEAEIRIAVDSGARIVGINNRDLTTMKTEIVTTARLRPLIPGDRIVVGESGIKDRRDVLLMKSLGVDAVLVGEALMASPDIAAGLRKLNGQG
jgi:indole-3-glycerol phosphate synthase